MKASPLPRKTARISDSLHRQLNMYALAAGAAGAGALVSASPAEAKVVYTPADVKIVLNAGLIKFDLNHDGVQDFGLSNRYWTSSSKWFTSLRVKPLKSANEISGKAHPLPFAYALAKGDKIGPQAEFHPDYPVGGVMAASDIDGYRSCYWRNATAYLGLKFVIHGKVHFGWARVKVTPGTRNGFDATLTGYAYETIPNKPIIAGATKGSEEPAESLGELAAGAAKR
jgi:hypothetical protein